MKHLIIPALLVCCAASPVLANEYVNSDFVYGYSATIEVGDDYEASGFGIAGRFSVSPDGKIVGDWRQYSDEIFGFDVDVNIGQLGYRHTLAQDPGYAFSVAAGVIGGSVETDFDDVLESFGVELEDSTYIVAADIEFGIGSAGVLDGEIQFTGIEGSEWSSKLGYTQYLAPNFGIRAAGRFGEDLNQYELGAVFRF